MEGRHSDTAMTDVEFDHDTPQTLPESDFTQRLLNLATRVFREGRLDIVADDGRHWRLGGGSRPRAAIRVRDARVLRHILRNPSLHFGETYMDGLWEPEGSLMDVLQVGMSFVAQLDHLPAVKVAQRFKRRFIETNDAARAKRNIHHHYDLDAGLYREFLDADMQYSCAYWADGVTTLEAAQTAKREHIATKLDLQPGARVLDIGCGWGGMALHLARHHGARVLGVTLSEEQHKVACERAKAEGLEDRVEFRIQDYRAVDDSFDAIVSVGMFEHVGRPQYATFFERVQTMLKPGGTALLHTIGRNSPPGGSNPWIQKYIFPGGYIPAASEVLARIEPTGLIVTDLEVLRVHYAKTLAEWNRRFQARRARFAERLGERFCRMWEFYLQASEAAFYWDNLEVFQIQMTRELQRLPLTRDYLYRTD
jgi:Cyclopropane fatty acid synthase and related methyltransferases